jgi:hypothetical protein
MEALLALRFWLQHRDKVLQMECVHKCVSIKLFNHDNLSVLAGSIQGLLARSSEPTVALKAGILVCFWKRMTVSFGIVFLKCSRRMQLLMFEF